MFVDEKSGKEKRSTLGALDPLKLAEWCLLLTFLLVAFVASLIGFAWLGYLAGLRLTRVQPLLALALVLLLPFVATRKLVRLDVRWIAWASVVFAMILASALWVSASFADVSCDGQSYQGAGILELLEGWNPVSKPEDAAVALPQLRFNMVHFAKGPWISAASLIALVGKVESGKAITFLSLGACFFLALYAGLKYSALSPAKLLVLGGLIALNPISLNQCLSSYVDGQLAALFTILLLCTCLLLLERRALNLTLTILTILLLINVKLTALVYVGVLGAACTLCILALRNFEALPAFAATYAAGILLGIAVGYNPYVTNFKETGNPFYPFAFNGSAHFYEQAFESTSVPSTFRGRNRFETLARSIFGRCSNDFDYETRTFSDASLKIPFTVSANEIRTFAGVDTRVCGWGPLTSGILLVAFFALITGNQGRRLHRQKRVIIALALCVLATIVVVPHPWWARFTPQLWLLPVLAAVALWLSTKKIHHHLGTCLIILMFANLAMVSVPCFLSTAAKTRILRSQLKWLAQQDRTYLVSFGDYPFNRLRFGEFGIRYRSVSEMPPQARQLTLAGDVLLSKTVVSLEE